MKRDPSRPKASDLDQAELLHAVDEAACKGVWVGDYFPKMPGKVVVARLRKMQERGWVKVVQDKYVLTQAGREALLN